MSEIEKMRRYIEKYKVPRTPRYDASINEIIAIASEMSPMEAANFAFVYGRAKGYRAAKAEGRRAERKSASPTHRWRNGRPI